MREAHRRSPQGLAAWLPSPAASDTVRGARRGAIFCPGRTRCWPRRITQSSGSRPLPTVRLPASGGPRPTDRLRGTPRGGPEPPPPPLRDDVVADDVDEAVGLVSADGLVGQQQRVVFGRT